MENFKVWRVWILESETVQNFEALKLLWKPLSLKMFDFSVVECEKMATKRLSEDRFCLKKTFQFSSIQDSWQIVTDNDAAWIRRPFSVDFEFQDNTETSKPHCRFLMKFILWTASEFRRPKATLTVHCSTVVVLDEIREWIFKCPDKVPIWEAVLFLLCAH